MNDQPRMLTTKPEYPIIVLISADAEWRVVRSLLADAGQGSTPWGETLSVDLGPHHVPTLFVQGGWGKIAAAASTQYGIDRWRPELLVNLGTCGGFAGRIRRFETIVAERTVVYDITERMGDPRAAISAFTTSIDLGWLGNDLPSSAVRATLVSADQDLDPTQLDRLNQEFHAVAADWESGAIAYVAQRNATRVLILRGVSDLVDSAGGEAYRDAQVFADGVARVMTDLVSILPRWIERRGQSA